LSAWPTASDWAGRQQRTPRSHPGPGRSCRRRTRPRGPRWPAAPGSPEEREIPPSARRGQSPSLNTRIFPGTPPSRPPSHPQCRISLRLPGRRGGEVIRPRRRPHPGAIETPAGCSWRARASPAARSTPSTRWRWPATGTGTRSMQEIRPRQLVRPWPTCCPPTCRRTGRCRARRAGPWPALARAQQDAAWGPHQRAQQAPLPPARVLPGLPGRRAHTVLGPAFDSHACPASRCAASVMPAPSRTGNSASVSERLNLPTAIAPIRQGELLELKTMSRVSRCVTTINAIGHRSTRVQLAPLSRSRFVKLQVGRVGLEPTADGL
jgi:hypothetical protein